MRTRAVAIAGLLLTALLGTGLVLGAHAQPAAEHGTAHVTPAAGKHGKAPARAAGATAVDAPPSGGHQLAAVAAAAAPTGAAPRYEVAAATPATGRPVTVRTGIAPRAPPAGPPA